ncbi:MAG TPA: M1 family metallopeptidase, partial [Planctomycetota bacterium]|nr:M1 family metallopeptidase [Planctomycetota bacterium]
PLEARTTHIDLDWTVDFDKRELRGSATLELALAPGAKQCVLDTRDLAIESVSDTGGRALGYRLGERDPLFGAPLTVELAPGVGSIVVRYRTTSAGSGLQWLEPAQTAGKRSPYLFSQAQAIHARTFLPCQDSPGVRVTYAATVRVANGLVAVMSAENRSRKDEPGVFRFEMKHAIPSYLIAIAVGDLQFRPIGKRTGVWSEPAVVDGAAREFSDLEKMVDAVESLFGPYRWGRYDVLVLPPSFPFGGMENPCMTFATPTLLAGDKSLVNVIAHELAHSWSGNLVTNATWRDFWLNEGFTVYLERRIVERLYGERAAAQASLLGREDLAQTLAELPAADTRLFLDLAGRDPDDGLTDVAYEKGCLFLTRLERAVGRAKFDPFLRAWFDEHAFQPVTTGQFERFVVARLLDGDARKAAELELRDWIDGAGLRADAPDFDHGVFAEPASAARSFADGATPTLPANAKRWNTAEWLCFLQTLPPSITAEQLARLDSLHALTSNTNAEIAAQWLEIAVRAKYEPAYPRLEQFLVEIGRRKFLKPLYTELAKSQEGLARANAIYAKARPGYHPIAQGTIDKLLADATAK